jgi:hypothetical protein
LGRIAWQCFDISHLLQTDNALQISHMLVTFLYTYHDEGR